MVEKQKEISVKTEKQEINRIEGFIEEICGHYNIFNSYFANINNTVIECFEIIYNHIINAELGKREVTILFYSGKNHLTFKLIAPVEVFKKEMLSPTPDEHENDIQKQYMIMKYLSDHLSISDDEKSCEISFYISSINYDKTIERNKFISEYFDKINTTKKV